ncbi:MAG TPA: DUF1127 domain-containing protein [Kiloniellaceae bacterium]|nr:DUF1127 domain-containing protein [Kiloniellaceae bacterium]HIP79664.1 DUF1127 domain-containing protein [Kiloniellaceae bacterium]
MTRLYDLQEAAAKGADVRWAPRSVDVLDVIQTARQMRARFIAETLTRGTSALGRWSGLTALVSALSRAQQRRRTIAELHGLSDAMLTDIGIERADIAAAATAATGPQTSHRSVWHVLAHRVQRSYRLRRTLRELSALSDKMLDDIGLDRANLDEVAAALVDGKKVAAASPSFAAAVASRPDVLASVTPASVTGTLPDLLVPANANLGRSTAA